MTKIELKNVEISKSWFTYNIVKNSRNKQRIEEYISEYNYFVSEQLQKSTIKLTDNKQLFTQFKQEICRYSKREISGARSMADNYAVLCQEQSNREYVNLQCLK